MIISFLPCGVCGELKFIEKLKKYEDGDILMCEDCINKKMNDKQDGTSLKDNKNVDFENNVEKM